MSEGLVIIPKNMRPVIEFKEVQRLIAAGPNDCQIGRRTRIPVRTIGRWRRQSPWARLRAVDPDRPACSSAVLPDRTYAYLLGLYLGDGCLTALPKALHRLEITLDARYPGMIFEAALAMLACGLRPGGPSGSAPGPDVWCCRRFGSTGPASSPGTGRAGSMSERSSWPHGSGRSRGSTPSISCAGCCNPMGPDSRIE
jgi:hypothetical protein